LEKKRVKGERRQKRGGRKERDPKPGPGHAVKQKGGNFPSRKMLGKKKKKKNRTTSKKKWRGKKKNNSPWAPLEGGNAKKKGGGGSGGY